MDIADRFVLTRPSNQNIVDIFDGEWSSKLPAHCDAVTRPGHADLFEDARVVWAEQVFGSFEGWKILELGPLEGAHSYMFQQRRARSILSIEANSRAYLKCLCIKELLKLDRVEFKLGDFMAQLRAEESRYDLIFASGVLYHMENPLELLQLIAKSSDRAFVWTHYYDESVLSQNEALAHKFEPAKPFEYGGVTYQASRQSYKAALDWVGFSGGSAPVSYWLTRDSLFKALKDFGFTDVQISFDHPGHPNGPALALCARR